MKSLLITSTFWLLVAVLIMQTTSPVILGEEIYGIQEPTIKEKEIIEFCDRGKLESSVRCMVSQMKRVYHYVETDDNIDLTFDELVEKGGDCKNYSERYKDWGLQLGFNAVTSRFRIDGLRGHQIAILSDETGYCIIDQIALQCVGFSE